MTFDLFLELFHLRKIFIGCCSLVLWCCFKYHTFLMKTSSQILSITLSMIFIIIQNVSIQFLERVMRLLSQSTTKVHQRMNVLRPMESFISEIRQHNVVSLTLNFFYHQANLLILWDFNDAGSNFSDFFVLILNRFVVQSVIRLESCHFWAFRTRLSKFIRALSIREMLVAFILFRQNSRMRISMIFNLLCLTLDHILLWH